MPTDPALIAWIPPEGRDVLRPTVGGGRAPFVVRFTCFDGTCAAWLFRPSEKPCGCPLSRNSWGREMSQSARIAFVAEAPGQGALLLAHNVPVPAGMDAGRRVLAEALGMDPSDGVLMHNPTVGWWLEDSGRVSAMYSPCGHTAAKTLALALAHHVGGRAVFADASGVEVTP